VVSVTDPYGRNLGFLDRSRYVFFQAAPQLYSRGWVGPVPDPLLLRKSGSAGNRTGISGSVARNSAGSRTPMAVCFSGFVFSALVLCWMSPGFTLSTATTNFFKRNGNLFGQQQLIAVIYSSWSHCVLKEPQAWTKIRSNCGVMCRLTSDSKRTYLTDLMTLVLAFVCRFLYLHRHLSKRCICICRLLPSIHLFISLCVLVFTSSFKKFPEFVYYTEINKLNICLYNISFWAFPLGWRHIFAKVCKASGSIPGNHFSIPLLMLSSLLQWFPRRSRIAVLSEHFFSHAKGKTSSCEKSNQHLFQP
jgi:hypothetical protein